MSTPRTVRGAEESPALIKHWRRFGPEEWGHVREGGLGLLLGSLLPVGLFYFTFRVWGFTVAVLAVLAWSGLVFAWHRRRTGGADVFSATTFGFACTKALAGVVSQNQTCEAEGGIVVILAGSFFGTATVEFSREITVTAPATVKLQVFQFTDKTAPITANGAPVATSVGTPGQRSTLTFSGMTMRR